MTPIDLLHPQSVRVETPSGWHEALRSGNEWAADGVHIRLLPGASGTELMASSGGAPLLALAVRWPLALAEKTLCLGDAWERGYGDLSWQPPCWERPHHWYVLIDECDVYSALGVRTLAASMCSWRLDGTGATLICDTSVGPAGVRLEGRELCACIVVAAQNEPAASAYDFARDYMRRLCDGPKKSAHVIYGGNNWYCDYGISSHARILENSAFTAEMAAGLCERPYMVIDDGWQLTSGRGICNGGPWTGNRDFPDMPGLAQSMKDVGVRPGIWTRPLLTSEHMPDRWVRGTTGRGRLLDPTVPEVLDYVESTMARIADWGFELIKHDFSTFDLTGLWGFQKKNYRDFSGGPFADDTKTLAEHIVQLYRTIARGAGAAAVLGCNTIGHLCAGLFEANRTGDDTSGRCWERTRRMGPNSLAMRLPQHGIFFECDADCAGITDQVDWRLNEQWLRLLSMSGTPLFVSCDGDQLTKDQKATLRTAFEHASRPTSTAKPMDWQSCPAPAHWRFGDECMTFDWYEPPQAGYPSEVWWL